MNIKYKITEYFEKNDLFDMNESFGLTIKYENNTLLIKGSSIDLIELADILTNLALAKLDKMHIHIDELTLLNKESNLSEIIIEKDNIK